MGNLTLLKTVDEGISGTSAIVPTTRKLSTTGKQVCESSQDSLRNQAIPQFESQRLSELAALLSEFSGSIEKIQTRLWDLLPIVRAHTYHPAFAGAFSLKSVGAPK
jgi:Domain of unknown function(DUF2779)